MGTKMKKRLIILVSIILLINTVFIVSSEKNNEDIDPLVDLSVTVEINKIRTLEKTDLGLFPIDKIDILSDPDFYVKVFINEEEFTSPIWYDTKYVEDPDWSATLNVPDDQEYVNVTIQLWDSNPNGDKLCDLSENYGDFEENYEIDLYYKLKTGQWQGDDWLIPIWGGVDKREIAKGPKYIDAVMRELAPLIETGGFIPTLDHTFPPDISWQNFCYYMEQKGRLLEGRFGA